MSLANYKCKPELKGHYEVKVKSHREVKNDKGGYYEVIFDVPEYGEYVYCIFQSQLDYTVSCLNRQAGVSRDTYSLEEVLDYFMKNPLDVWFSYNETHRRMNVSLHDNTPVTEDAIDEDLM